MADEQDNIKREFQSAAEETAAVFGNTLASISAEYARRLREEADNIDDLGKSLLRNFKNDLASLGRSSTALLDIQTKLLNGNLKQQDIAKAIQSIDLKINKIRNDRNQLELEFGKLSKKQEEDFTKALAIAQEQKKSIKEQGQELDNVNKKLGITGTALGIAGGILKKITGSNPFENIVSEAAAANAQIKLNNEELEDSVSLTKERRAELIKENNNLKSQTTVRGQISKRLKESLTTTNLLTVAGAAILKSFLELNKVQTEFRRLTGESAQNFTNFNDSLISGIDQIKTLTALTEQFGFNANAAFDQINIQEATELEVLLGLSAEEAGLLAFNAQVSGENLKDGANNAFKGVSPLLSQRKILQEISKVSPSIAMSFSNSNEELAKAASNARLLGLNLSQVDKTAESLLDIESSLTAEFEAEVISGRQLNLERARFFALTNNLAGVTQELTKQGITQENFAGKTRIEQEAIAKAVGLSRDELSKSIQEQAILSKMSAEEIKAKELSDSKRLTAQQQLNKAIEKMTVALAGPVDLLASLVSNTAVLYTTMAAIGVVMTQSILGSMAKLGAAMIPVIARMGTLVGLSIADATAKLTALSATTLGVGTVIALAAAAGGIAFLYNKVKESKSQAVNDGIAPSSKGPFTITDSFGATAITAKGDGLAVSPNIQRESRNTPTSVVLSDAQIQKIANAVRDGASRATINLDGDRVSSRLQTPMITNTLPGV